MDEFLIYDSLPSTNEFALGLLSQEPACGTSVLAYRQTAGRGQDGRIWQSDLGGLYLSIILRDVDLSDITLRIGNIAKGYLESVGVNCDIKLPNDILYRGEKICGILVESRTRLKSVWAVCGIGLNVNNKYSGYTNLSEILGRKLDILAVAKEIRECMINGI